MPLSFELPRTANNERILERFESNNIVNNTYRPIKVEVFVGHVQLHFDRLLITSINYENNTYNCKLINGDDFWIEQADKTFLRDLDFGSFEFTEANVVDNWNNPQWQNGNDLIYLPLVDYGNGGTSIPFGGSDINFDDGGTGTDTINLPNHGFPVTIPKKAVCCCFGKGRGVRHRSGLLLEKSYPYQVANRDWVG